MVSYWYAHQFIAPRGEAIYQSVSDPDDSFYVAKNRQLLNAKIAAHYTIRQDIEIGARFEGYYDILMKHFDYSYGLYFIFNHDFKLATLGKKKHKKQEKEE